MTEAPKKPTRIENLAAPEVFVTDRPDFWRAKNNVHMTLTTARLDHETSAVAQVVIARLVMPIPIAQQLAVDLFNWLDGLGLRPGGTPTREEVQ